MRTARLIGLGLLPVLAIAALLFLAQRLAVEAYWEMHPEAKLQAEVRRPLVEKALLDLRERREKEALSLKAWLPQGLPSDSGSKPD